MGKNTSARKVRSQPGTETGCCLGRTHVLDRGRGFARKGRRVDGPRNETEKKNSLSDDAFKE